MKKITAFLALLALVALPASAMAAKTGDFEIGGYIKLHTWWDSTSMVNKNITAINVTGAGTSGRNNAFGTARQGRFRMTAQDTRFNFKIKGPEVWGAKTQGYIEVDFDGSGQDPASTVTNAVLPRLRHAWFRMDWPGGWQVLMGQYWGVMCDFWPDTVQSGPLFAHGMSTQRLPQIRVTYKTGPWRFDALAGTPGDENDNPTFAAANINGFPWLSGTGAYPGGRSVMPQFGVQATYEKDLWGKAAFFSRPRGFTASVSFAIQRMVYDGGVSAARTWGQNNYAASAILQERDTMTPWMLQASLFIPVLPTQTQDLKGTASVQAQFYVGQGLRAFGNDLLGGNNSYWEFDAPANLGGFANVPTYNRKLMKRYGGYIQGQYYFNNEWYLSYLYGFSKAYGVNRDRNLWLQNVIGINNGYEFATAGDPIKFIQEHDISLFYRPNANFKFGLSYVYLNQNYFQSNDFSGAGNPTTRGDSHRVQFAGWFFF
jgi:hypothetical protein